MTDQLGPLVRQLRVQSGLTQEQVAERSRVSVRTIRRLETGKSTDHRLGTVSLLADALGVGPQDRQRLAAALATSRAGAVAEPPEPAPAPPESGEESGAEPGTAVPFAAVPPAPLAPARGTLAKEAEDLAQEIRRRWQREEGHRRVHDPFPLPVRWRQAPAGLTDHEANIQRAVPGAAVRQVDLSGDLRSVVEVYQRIRSGRLVILGRAGSGKSILTIRFVLDLIEARVLPGRAPVIFSLGSWDPTTTALSDWLTERLLRDHPYLARRVPNGSSLAAALVDADLILPVLDGFDELAEGLRPAALDALNATSLPLVLTSRRDEFAEAVDAAGAPLVWAAGVELTDLTLDDVAAYLPRTARAVTQGSAGREPGAVWDTVLEELRAQRTQPSVDLGAVLTTPLMVILARTMYSESTDRDPAELLDAARFPDRRHLEDHLLAGFVPSVYRRRAPDRAADGDRRRQRNWDPERAEHWLGYLADHLVRVDRDRQDLAWWQIGDSLGLPTRILGVVLASALCVGVPDWFFGVLWGQSGSGVDLLQAALMGPVAGLAFGATYGVFVASNGGLFEPARVRLRLPGRRRGTARGPARAIAARVAAVLLGGFMMGVGCACAFAIERCLYFGMPLTSGTLIQGTLINMLVLGLIFGLAAGLIFGLMAVFEVPVDVTSAATPIGLLASNRSTVRRQVLVLVPTVVLAIAFGGQLIIDLFQGVLGQLLWGLSDGFLAGAIGGVGGVLAYAFGFTAWGQWVVLARVWLPLTGRLPWNPVAFLDDAYQRGVLRQTGAVYQFRHIRLQHHLGRGYRQRHPNYAPASFTTPPDQN